MVEELSEEVRPEQQPEEEEVEESSSEEHGFKISERNLQKNPPYYMLYKA
jgi:hypothetical protein